MTPEQEAARRELLREQAVLLKMRERFQKAGPEAARLLEAVNLLISAYH